MEEISVLVLEQSLAEAREAKEGEFAVCIIESESDDTLSEEVPEDFAEHLYVLGREAKEVSSPMCRFLGALADREYLSHCTGQFLELADFVRADRNSLPPTKCVNCGRSDLFVTMIHIAAPTSHLPSQSAGMNE